MAAAYLAGCEGLCWRCSRPGAPGGRRRRRFAVGSSSAEQKEEEESPVVAAAMAAEPHRWERSRHQGMRGRAGTSIQIQVQAGWAVLRGGRTMGFFIEGKI